MNKSAYVLNAFKELVDKREIRNEDYEAVLESVVNHYDMALVGNLLFIKFVTEIDNVREVSTAGKTIIEIPFRDSLNYNSETVFEKWQRVLKENFHLDLTKVEFWKVNYAGNGITSAHLYAVKFRRFPWISHLEDEVSKISDNDTKEFVCNEEIKKELEDKVCRHIKSKVIIDVNDFLVELSNHIEGVMKHGIRTKVGFDDDITKPTLVKEKGANGYTVFIPHCALGEYTDLIRNTLGFQRSVYDTNVFFPNPGIMADLI